MGLKPQSNKVICSMKEEFAKLNISSVRGLYINEVIVSVEPKSETIHLTEMIIIYTTSNIYLTSKSFYLIGTLLKNPIKNP